MPKPKLKRMTFSVIVEEGDVAETQESFAEWFAGNEVSMWGSSVAWVEDVPRAPKGARAFFTYK